MSQREYEAAESCWQTEDQDCLQQFARNREKHRIVVTMDSGRDWKFMDTDVVGELEEYDSDDFDDHVSDHVSERAEGGDEEEFEEDTGRI